jgi:hypothetical protein
LARDDLIQRQFDRFGMREQGVSVSWILERRAALKGFQLLPLRRFGET